MAQKYVYSSACGWGLTLSGAAFGVAGILAIFIASPFLNIMCVISLALMTAFAVANANFAAAAAMHAASGLKGRIHWPTFWPALAVTLLFAFGSAGGVHMGWLVLADMAPDPSKLPDIHLVDLAALVLCVAKPAMTWIVEGRRAIDQLAEREAAERAADDRRQEEAAERDRMAAEARRAAAEAQRSGLVADPLPTNIVALPAHRPNPKAAKATTRTPPSAGRRVAGALAIATLAATAITNPVEAKAPTTTTDTTRGDEAGAVEALKAGIGPRPTSERFGISYHRARQLKAMIDAGTKSA